MSDGGRVLYWSFSFSLSFLFLGLLSNFVLFSDLGLVDGASLFLLCVLWGMWGAGVLVGLLLGDE